MLGSIADTKKVLAIYIYERLSVKTPTSGGTVDTGKILRKSRWVSIAYDAPDVGGHVRRELSGSTGSIAVAGKLCENWWRV